MNDFVQLWVYLASTPLFGLTATLVVYAVASAVYERFARAPWANPVLWSVVILGILLSATHTAYPVYFAGAQFIHVLLGPAVVALAWPLWQRRGELRRRGVALTIAALVGGSSAAGASVALGWAIGLPGDVLRSLAPKSVTSPVAMGIAERIGGVPALAAVFAIVTGIVGALSAKYLFNLLRINSWAVRGFALAWHWRRPRIASGCRGGGLCRHSTRAASAISVTPVAACLPALLASVQMSSSAGFAGRAGRPRA